MMKSKFMAGLVATLICLVFVVVAAIFITESLSGKAGDRLIKIIAFAAIGIWLGLYSWLKPKVAAENQENASKETNEKSDDLPPRQTGSDRNSYR